MIKLENTFARVSFLRADSESILPMIEKVHDPSNKTPNHKIPYCKVYNLLYPTIQYCTVRIFSS